MATDLTIPLPDLSMEQVAEILEGTLYEPPQNIARQLLAAMQDNAKLRKCLKNALAASENFGVRIDTDEWRAALADNTSEYPALSGHADS